MDRRELIMNIMNLEVKTRRLNVFSLLELSPPFEMEILSCVRKGGDKGVRVSEIAKSLFTTSPNISRLLKVLEKDGKVYREVDEQDRRNTFVHITDKGIEYFLHNRKTICEFMFGVINCLSDEELSKYSEIREKIYSSYLVEIDKYKERAAETENKGVQK